MKKALILLAEGFEETEAITTHDILTRTHEIEVTYLSVEGSLRVSSSMGTLIEAGGLLGDSSLKDFDFLVLPGGKIGVANLKRSPRTITAIRFFIDAHKPIYAICAAPSILGELGYLDGKKYTCFPGFQAGKGEYVDAGVVVDGDLITGHSMAYTLDFAEAIVRKELGEEAVSRLIPGTRGVITAK